MVSNIYHLNIKKSIFGQKYIRFMVDDPINQATVTPDRSWTNLSSTARVGFSRLRLRIDSSRYPSIYNPSSIGHFDPVQILTNMIPDMDTWHKALSIKHIKNIIIFF